MKRTLEEINRKIADGDAVILTAKEIEQMVESGREKEIHDVDVVTTGTMGIMSGTYALLSFQITEAGKYKKFRSATINGVPTSVGPCPNESLGIIDLMVFGTMESEENERYGGSFLIRDLVEGKQATLEATAIDGSKVEKNVTINDMPTAKLMSTRNCFRNYRGFVNPSNKEFRSIFSCTPFPPNYGGLAFSGCGHLNPVQNDPELKFIGVGTNVLFNGNEGYVFSTGTRCSAKYPNLMTVADMKGMDPSLMGGFLTAAGVENLASYAVAIPILDESMLKPVLTRDSEIPLSVGDIRDRHKIGQSSYGEVWSGRDEVISFEEQACLQCDSCDAEESCPTYAIKRINGTPTVDRTRCINCGACVVACEQGSFKGLLGEAKVKFADGERTIPIICRSSNREGAIRTMTDLKKRILDGEFKITNKVANIQT